MRPLLRVPSLLLLLLPACAGPSASSEGEPGGAAQPGVEPAAPREAAAGATGDPAEASAPVDPSEVPGGAVADAGGRSALPEVVWRTRRGPLYYHLPGCGRLVDAVPILFEVAQRHLAPCDVCAPPR